MQIGSRFRAGTGRARSFEDSRGRLTLVPFDELPFTPARSYVLSAIPPDGRRGGHANRTQHRFLVILAGSAEVVLREGAQTEHATLAAGETVLIHPGVWHEIRALGPDLMVLVLAEGAYDPGDQIDRPSTAATAASTPSATRAT